MTANMKANVNSTLLSIAFDDGSSVVSISISKLSAFDFPR